MTYLAAIVLGRYSVEDLVVFADQSHSAGPLVAFSSPVGVCLVARVPGQPSCELKERRL